MYIRFEADSNACLWYPSLFLGSRAVQHKCLVEAYHNPRIYPTTAVLHSSPWYGAFFRLPTRLVYVQGTICACFQVNTNRIDHLYQIGFKQGSVENTTFRHLQFNSPIKLYIWGTGFQFLQVILSTALCAQTDPNMSIEWRLDTATQKVHGTIIPSVLILYVFV